MTWMKKMTMVFALLTLVSINICGADYAQGQSRGKRQGPPPEAYTACEDKIAGDTAQFASPRGETVTGTCEQQGGRLVLRPARHRTQSGGRQHGPPPEAYTVCEDKSVGDKTQLINTRGETMNGICEQEDDRLVFRPDRSNRNADSKRGDF